MVRDIEDENRVEKKHPPFAEDSITLLNTSYSLGESETREEIDLVTENYSKHCNVQCDDDSDTDFKSAPNIFHYELPLKKRNFGDNDICKNIELSKEHSCIVCDLADGCAVPCSGNECPLVVHRKCVELDSENPATSYCPYCWFKEQATRSTTLRTMVVAAAKALVRYGCTELKSGDLVMAQEKSQLENDSDKSLPMLLHENLHQLQEVVKQLKARNIQLDESVDKLINIENDCGEVSAVVNEHPKRVLWTVEEEYMLKVGVETFSVTINKNMPWKKILEMGKDVFHKTRNSSDLKDKWRKMVHM